MAWAQIVKKSERERRLEAILKALLKEPSIVQASKIPLVKRVAKGSGVSEEEVWWLTGLEKPEPSTVPQD